MSNKTITVIVFHSKESVYLFSDEVSRENFTSLNEALKAGEASRKVGANVIVRPNYNEGNNTFFQEWRSFNGNAFECCRWEIP